MVTYFRSFKYLIYVVGMYYIGYEIYADGVI